MVLLDVGGSTRLTGYSEEEQERLRNKNYSQIHRLLTKLIAGRIERIYRAPHGSVLAALFEQMEGKDKDSIRSAVQCQLYRRQIYL